MIVGTWSLDIDTFRVVKIVVNETEMGTFRSSAVNLDRDRKLHAQYYSFVDLYYMDKDLDRLVSMAYGTSTINRSIWEWIPYEVGSKYTILLNTDTEHPGESWRYAILGYMINKLGGRPSYTRFVEMVFFIKTQTQEREELYCYYKKLEDTVSRVDRQESLTTSVCYSTADSDFEEPIIRTSHSISTNEIRSIMLEFKWSS